MNTISKPQMEVNMSCNTASDESWKRYHCMDLSRITPLMHMGHAVIYIVNVYT